MNCVIRCIAVMTIVNALSGCGDSNSYSESKDIESFGKDIVKPWFKVRFNSAQNTLDYSFIGATSVYGFKIQYSDFRDAIERFASSPAHSLVNRFAEKVHSKQRLKINELSAEIDDLEKEWNGRELKELRENRTKFVARIDSTKDPKMLEFFASRLQQIDEAIAVHEEKQSKLNLLKEDRAKALDALIADIALWKKTPQIADLGSFKVDLAELIEQTKPGKQLTLDFRERKSQILLWPIRYQAAKYLWTKPVELYEVDKEYGRTMFQRALEETTTMFMLSHNHALSKSKVCAPKIASHLKLPPNIYLLSKRTMEVTRDDSHALEDGLINAEETTIQSSSIWIADGKFELTQLIENALQLNKNGCQGIYLYGTDRLYPKDGPVPKSF